MSDDRRGPHSHPPPRVSTRQLLSPGTPIRFALDAVEEQLVIVEGALREVGVPLMGPDLDALLSLLRPRLGVPAGRAVSKGIDWGREDERKRPTTAKVSKAYLVATAEASGRPATEGLVAPTLEGVARALAADGVEADEEWITRALALSGLPLDDGIPTLAPPAPRPRPR